MTEVYINSTFVGNVENPDDFVRQVRDERRNNNVSQEINVRFNRDADSIEVEYDKGRIRRPLIVVVNGEPKLNKEDLNKVDRGELTWEELVLQGIVEYVDANEEEDCLIAFYPEELTKAHTHLEIAPFVILSLATSLVPYANHCQATRAHGGSKSQKQALGFYAANYSVRMDTDVNLFHYPQTPIVKSIMYDIANENEHPAGQNLTVAVLSYEGYNMDDSVIINKSSVQRGLGRSTFFRPYVAEELRYSGGLVDEIGIPDKDVKGYKSEHDYRFLSEDGICHLESHVKPDDVLIGKSSPPRFLSRMDEYTLGASSRRESSVSVRHGEEGTVDFVTITENEEGNKFVQVRVRDQRLPEVGDKFSTRHGQKGIVGMLFPHSIPTRMTVSHLIELIGGKVGASFGRTINATAFDNESETDLRKQLLDL